MNSSSLLSTLQELGLMLQYPPNTPHPLALIMIPSLSPMNAHSSIAPPELYMLIKPMGANSMPPLSVCKQCNVCVSAFECKIFNLGEPKHAHFITDLYW